MIKSVPEINEDDNQIVPIPPDRLKNCRKHSKLEIENCIGFKVTLLKIFVVEYVLMFFYIYFQNFGNTCYLNSALQAVLSIPNLVDEATNLCLNQDMRAYPVLE